LLECFALQKCACALLVLEHADCSMQYLFLCDNKPMLQKLGLERNHFLLGLIPWIATYVSAPFVLYFASAVLFIVGITVLIICYLKKGRTYAGQVFLAFIIITLLWYILGLLLSQFQTGLYWLKRLYIYNL